MFGDVDPSTPAIATANSGNVVTTASFTPPAGAVLTAHAWHDTASGNTTNTSAITDSGGTAAGWTIEVTRNRADSGGQNGHVQVSTAVATGTPMTVTTTGTNTAGSCSLYVTVDTGVDTTTRLDVKTEGSNTASAIAATLPASVTDNTRARLVASDWNVGANMTAGAGQTALISQGIGAGPDMRIYLGTRNALTTPIGTAESLSTAAPTSGNVVNWVAYALRPALAPAGAAPAGIAVPAASGTPTTALGLATAPAGLALAAATGTPATAVNGCAPAGLAAAVTAGTPSASLNLGAAPPGIAVPVAVGQPSAPGSTPTPNGVGLAVALGTPTVAINRAAAPTGAALPVASGTPRVGAGRPLVVRPHSGTVVRPGTGLVTRPQTGHVIRP